MYPTKAPAPPKKEEKKEESPVTGRHVRRHFFFFFVCLFVCLCVCFFFLGGELWNDGPITAKIAGSIVILPRCVLNDFFT